MNRDTTHDDCEHRINHLRMKLAKQERLVKVIGVESDGIRYELNVKSVQVTPEGTVIEVHMP